MINKVILLGNLGKDAEIKGEGDRSVLSISLATEDGYFDKKNEWISSTEWHNIKAFGKLALRHAGLVKGTKIYVEGKIKTTPKKDSNEKYYQIVVDGIKVITKPNIIAPIKPHVKPAGQDDFDDDIPF